MAACKILIVEDELLIAADIERNLTQAGHQIIGIAESYTQAVALTEHQSPDLILMDIGLRGDKDGIAAAATIRERWQIPVVFLTANADQQTIAQARAAGPYGFLTKPFRSEELAETVRIAIDQNRRVQRLFASQRWLATVLDSMTDAVIATDADAHVRYLNPAAEALTGWTPVEAEGRSIDEVYPLSDMAGNKIDFCLLKKALATGEFYGKNRFVLTTKTGQKVVIEDSAAPVREGDNVIGAVAIFLDIAERLRTERRQELERDRLSEQAKNAHQALSETRAELRALAADLMSTQEHERQRIARELHDDLGQQTALLGMSIDRSAQNGLIDKATAQDLMSRVNGISVGLREVSHRLHPSILSDLGLSAALRSLVEQAQSLGREVTFHERDVPGAIPLDTATALYRIAQEGLRNAATHSPGAAVRVVLSRSENELRLRIQDDGPGFPLIEARGRGGLGLVSMQKRARLARGDLYLSSTPGEGTILLVRVPLED